MSTGPAGDNQGTSTRPYLLRALHDWCTDNGFTPYIAVHVDGSVQVPAEYVKNDEIVLNIGFEATSGLKLGNQFIEFKARFGGMAREIVVPIDHVVAIYARENGQGMAFPVPTGAGTRPAAEQPAARGAGAAPRGSARASAQRGLRLARQGTDSTDRAVGGEDIGRRDPVAAGEAAAGSGANSEPPARPAAQPALPPSGEPPEPTPPRPSLKRVK